ncbi:MAG: GNAT family N-acetyltransferase [Flavobacteriales bacterium]|jgi:hypothetical protein
MQTAKQRYAELCASEVHVPLFSQAWWLDAVCPPHEWDVLLYEEGGHIEAALPYQLSRKWGIRFVINPALTQGTGIWYRLHEGESEHDRLSREKKAATHIVEELKRLKLAFFMQHFSPDITNWLPFYWSGFTQTTRYTYRISDIRNPEACFEAMSYAKQKQIRKAAELIVTTAITPQDFYRHHAQSLRAKGKKIFYPQAVLERIHAAASARHQILVIGLQDAQGDLHAALWIVYDGQCAYNLISSISPEHAASGASSRVVFEAIKHLKDACRTFDFEGSMDEGIENSFRQFGALQTPYFRVIKAYNRMVFAAVKGRI